MTTPYREPPPIKPSKPGPVDLEPSTSGASYLTVALVTVALAGGLFLAFGSREEKPSSSGSGDLSALVIEHGTSRFKYIGPRDESLGTCVCAEDVPASGQWTCACTGPVFDGKAER